MVQRVRLYSTRIFVILLFVVILFANNKWKHNTPLLGTFLFSVGCFLVGVATLGRMWCSMYIAGHKKKHLITMGPYSICRNPLYFFSMVGGIGIGFASETLIIPTAIAAAFMLYYPHIIHYEEKNLRNLHGELYDAYISRTPQFWPKWSLLNEPEEYLVNPKIFKKHIFSAFWFVWLLGILELIEDLHEVGAIPEYFPIY
jgi:protein-S-isoprenylcysteine O-methyltransferase Ste14